MHPLHTWHIALWKQPQPMSNSPRLLLTLVQFPSGYTHVRDGHDVLRVHYVLALAVLFSVLGRPKSIFIASNFVPSGIVFRKVSYLDTIRQTIHLSLLLTSHQE